MPTPHRCAFETMSGAGITLTAPDVSPGKLISARRERAPPPRALDASRAPVSQLARGAAKPTLIGARLLARALAVTNLLTIAAQAWFRLK